MFRWARFARLGPAFDAFAASGDWAGGGAGGRRRRGPGRARAGDGRGGRRAHRAHRAGRDRWSPARRCRSTSCSTRRPTATWSSPSTARRCRCRRAGRGCGRSTRPAPIVVTLRRQPGARSTPWSPRAAATLRLTSPDGARWSVTDATGGAWFADGVSRPSGTPTTGRSSTPTRAPTALTVPAGPLHVVAARGLEFARLRGRRHAGGGGDRDRRVRPAAAVRPGRPTAGTAPTCTSTSTTAATTCCEPGRRRADAARRGPRADAPHRRQPRRCAGLRPGAAGGDGGRGPAWRTARSSARAWSSATTARARARPRPDRRPGAAVHRPGGHRPPVGLAAQQRGVRGRCATSAR